MKMKFSNVVKLFLAGACFVAVGCNDYGQDIENLNNRIDAIEAGTIDPLKADLEGTKANLAAAQKAIQDHATQHAADVAALQAADAALDAAVKKAANDAAKALSDLSAEMKSKDDKLAADLQTLSSTLASQIAAVDAKADKNAADIAKAVNDAAKALADAKAELEAANTALENAYKAADSALAAELAAATETLSKQIADEVAKLNEAIAKANGDAANNQEAIAAVNAALASTKALLEQAIAAAQQDLTLAIQNGDAEVKSLLESQIATLNETLSKKIADVETALNAKIAKVETDVANNAAAITALQAALDAAIANLNEAIAAGDTKNAEAIVELDAKLTKLIEDYVAGLNEDIAEINNEIKGLKASDENLQNQINELVTALANTNEEVAQNAANIAAVNAALEEAIAELNEAIAAGDKKLEDAMKEMEATINGKIDALEAAAKAMREDLEDHIAAYTLFKGEVEGRLAALEAQVAALEAKDVVIEGLIAALDTRLAANEELAAQNAADIIANKDLFDAFVLATEKTLAELKAADAALVTNLNDLKKDLMTFQSKVRAELDEHYGAFAAYQSKVEADFAAVNAEIAVNATAIAANAESIAANKTLIEELTADLAAKYEELNTSISTLDTKYLGITDALGTRLTTLENAHAELATAHNDLVAEVAAYKEQTNETLASIAAEQITQDGKIKLNADQIAELQDGLTNLNKVVEDNYTAVNNAIDAVEAALNEQIEALKDGLDALKGRIQSLVFVPEYTDGKATINWAVLGETIVESQSVLLYQVFPANCAAAIAKEDLTFLLTGLKTRAAEPVLNVVGVKVADANKGIVAVTVNTRNLGADFYNGSANYATSLVLTTETANIASCYVNLIPAKREKLDVCLINDTAAQQKIEYTDLEKVVTVLPEHKYNFTVNGEGAYTIEEMLAKGYDIVVEKGEPTYEFNAPGMLPDVFKTVVDYTNPYLNYVNVSLAEATKEAVGGVKTVKYSYNVCGKTLTASATVRVVKIQRAMEWKGADIVWNYEEDAYSDAGAITSSKDIATIVASNLPEDVTYENLLAITPTITVSVDGAETKDVVAIFGGNNNKPMIALENFEWNKTYTIVAVYELSSIDVTITATVNTIDRVRDGIVIKLAPEQWTLTKNFSLKSETADEDLTVVYDMLVANKVNTTKKADEFLKDIFINHTYNNDYNTANEAELNITKLAINDQNGATIKSAYSIEEFETIPEKVEYVYTVTTWYGQKITFTKTLNIGLKPVEITLAEETKSLVKDLEFTTDAEKLAEIYELVTNVDKKNIDAVEYLKSIFVDNKLRSQVDLANGVALANTKLVVNAENGNSATAAYNYVDFEATPEAVVYKSTYTTWYGQVITINKVVNIDWTTYNYVHIPEWVYNNDGYYSNALASYVEKQPSLFEEIIISLDMDTAFKVVDKAGATINDLKALGLTSKFGFAVDPVDSRIQFLSGSNRLYYHGHDLTVGVKGQLVLENSNGVKTVLPTNFDKGQIYADYYVKQYNPVGKLTSANLDIPIAPIAKKYTYYAMNQLSLNDKRPGVEANLIEKGELVKNDDNFVTWSNAAWVIGDGSNNFAVGVNAKDIYGLKVTKFSCTGIPEDMKQLYFDTDNGMLYFDNTNQIELTTPIILKVKVDITHQWANDSAEFTVTLYNKK